MSTLYVTEYANMAGSNNGTAPQMVQAPGAAEQTVAITGASVQSAPFSSDTRVVRVHADAICSIKFGDNPTVTAASKRMVAGQTEYFGVRPGSKVAVITNS